MTSLRRGTAASPAPQREPSLSLDPEHVSRFGPYAETYRPEPARDASPRQPPPYALAPQGPRVPWPAPPPLPEADVTVKAANGNTQRPGPVAAAMDAANDTTTIVPMARQTFEPVAPAASSASVAAAPAESIDVTVSRETATVSFPVSEARWPQSLHAAFAKAQALAGQAAVELPSDALYDDHLEVIDAAPATTTDNEFTARDLAFIGRMAPQAAE